MEAIHFIQDLAVILTVAGVVGWVCQRLGLSTVVGFLVAGLVVGPHTPPFALVTDVPRVETLAQLGLVFLMFAIGLRLSVRKLRRLGFSLLLAVCASAGIIFALTRLLGAAVGLSAVESLFLAGMLMVSSSAIISKVLLEACATHERSGQLAMGVVVLEDVVAVVMLTLLNSIVQFGGPAEARVPLGETLGMLGAFVALAGVGGLILVPWLLRRMSIAADEELQTLGIAGLLFLLALLAFRAGYSIALGAFLLGTIVAETPHRAQVERLFEGMRDVFSAVFFVAIGMQIDPRALGESAGLIAGLAVFTLLVRTGACTTGLALIGTPFREALRTGLSVLPIGEFSFIIAQLGVSAGVVSERFYPLAVGLSLLTTLAATPATRHSERLSDMVMAWHPKWLGDWLRAYYGWLDHFAVRQKRSLLWQMSRKRLIQVSVGLLFVTGLLIFSEKLLSVLEDWLGADWPYRSWLDMLFWSGLTLVALVPLVAIWRNLSAMAMLYAEVTARGHPHEKKLRPFIENGLKVVGGAGLFVWLASVLPAEGVAKWLLLLCGALAIVTVILLRRKLIYWHSEVEVELQTMLEPEKYRISATSAPWLQSHDDWNLAVIDCVVPDLADCQGRSLRELGLRSRFGCTVVGIERQGYMIPLPPPEAVLYPRDKALLMGTPEQVRAGREFLGLVTGSSLSDSLFEEVRMEALAVPAWSRVTGCTIGEVAPAKQFGVQVAGLHRAGLRILNPKTGEVLRAGDELLVLGTTVQIRQFRDWLRERPEDPLAVK
ncbi:MAG: cation:proton antiporter [Opitutae bacterium]|nr:cation:proton antiporter [Opitutae bacterium]